jgi:hypothetical protein
MRKEQEAIENTYERQREQLEYQIDLLKNGKYAANEARAIMNGMDPIMAQELTRLEKIIDEAKQRESDLAKVDKDWADMDAKIRAGNASQKSKLESERDRTLKSGDQNVAATIAPAIQAGTVEAYKFLNQQNEQKLARQEQKERLDVIAGELKKLNEKQFATLERKR